MEKIIAGWDTIQQIAATVPTDNEIEGWLRRAGGPVHRRSDRPERCRGRPGHRVRALLPQPVHRGQVELDAGDRRRVG